MEFIGFIMLVVALNAIVTLAIASFVRSTVLAVIASTAITEMLVAIYILTQAKHSPDAADVISAANIVAILTTPLILGTSYGFVFCLRRLLRKRSS